MNKEESMKQLILQQSEVFRQQAEQEWNHHYPVVKEFYDKEIASKDILFIRILLTIISEFLSNHLEKQKEYLDDLLYSVKNMK